MVNMKNISFRASLWKTGKSKVVTVPYVLAALMDDKKQYRFIIQEVKDDEI